MTGRLRVFAAIPPGLLRPLAVRWLFRLTADAFGVRPPPLGGMSGDDLLRAYARFSGARSQQLLTQGDDLEDVGHGLWTGARRVGERLRRGLGLRAERDVMLAARAVYRVIGIELSSPSAGRVVVSRCTFARTYRPEVCALMSSLDAGLFAGLTGGRRLSFSRRISEGSGMCVATLERAA